MADSVTLQYRGIVVEDFQTITSFAQTTATVLGLGSGITVTPLVTAQDDSAAASAGVPLGGVYVNSGGAAFSYLATRLS